MADSAGKSQMASALSKAGGTDVRDSDIYNAVVDKMSNPADLANYQAGSDFKPYGSELASNSNLVNDYLTTLVKQFGMIFQKVALAQNPLNYFKKGVVPFGGQIESILYDTIEQKAFNPNFRDEKGNERSPFEQNWGRVEGRTYQDVQDISTPVTIFDTIDTQYFMTLQQFHTFIWGKITALVNGAVLDEYRYTKLTLSKPIADQKMPTLFLGKNADIKSLAKAIKKTAKKMRYFSRDMNALGINQSTLSNDICVIVNVDKSTDLDMDYFGTLFNPETGKDYNVKYIEIDQFPSIWKYTKDHVVTQDDADKGFVDVRSAKNPYGKWSIGDTLKSGTLAKQGATDASEVLNGDKVDAVVLDRDALQVWDQLPTVLTTQNNARGRYTNVFLNKKTLFNYIMGLNALAIVEDDKPAVDK